MQIYVVPSTHVLDLKVGQDYYNGNGKLDIDAELDRSNNDTSAKIKLYGKRGKLVLDRHIYAVSNRLKLSEAIAGASP